MSTNPNNAVGTNGAYGGRTSVNAFNDVLAAYSRGILSGWECVPNSGMTVSLGGDGNTRDVAIAEDNAGNRTSINNISGAPVDVTIASAPGANSRIDAVVAYVDNPPTGTSTVADNPAACGIIAVAGTVASSPVAPNDSAIRTAITADGASGTTAYYVVLAQVTVENGTTDITAGDITAGDSAKLTGTGVVSSNNIDFTTLGVVTDYVPLNTSKTVALTPGRWFVSAWCTILTSTNASDTPKLAFSLNNTEYLTTFAGSTTQANWENLAIWDLVTINSGDIFKVITDKGVSQVTARSRIVAIKLG